MVNEGSQRSALLVGASVYQDPRLAHMAGPSADVAGLADVLADPELGGFAVQTVLDEEMRTVRIAIARLCQNARRNDVILVYYTGHGLRDVTGRLYLGVRDSELAFLHATALSTAFVLHCLERCRSKAKVLILDSAFSGAVLRGVPAPDNVVILASTGAFQMSAIDSDGDPPPGSTGPVSLFTRYLVDGLCTGNADLDGDGIVMFDELFMYARARVIEAQPDQQPRLFNLADASIRAAVSPKHVLISYSHVDTAFVRWLSAELQKAGHRTWVDTGGIGGGEEWRQKLVTAIDAAKAIVVAMSQDALAATWVRREIEYADRAGKPVIPIVVRPADPPAWFTLAFGGLQHIDFTNENVRLEALAQLRDAIRERCAAASRMR